MAWHVVEIKQYETGDAEDADKAVGKSIVTNEIGAIATGDEEATDGYYLVEFTEEVYIYQRDGALKCEGNW